MCAVIIGGNERMEREYTDLCRRYGYKAKVFCKLQSGLRDRIGNPDLMILFTHTTSHKMIQCAVSKTCPETRVVRTHSSSIASLRKILEENR
ncbi:MAG: DUF2325 domain-containing protein [Parasporobacterium sp.]|nr:DUF2325 domain-containing protein [Parasporobacterium sp.]